jgi:hypothetical protein
MEKPQTDALSIEPRDIDVSQLVALEKNARYMTAEQQARLTGNVEKDGVLTSTPLVWLMQSEDGAFDEGSPKYLVVSGNHRVFSAKQAGQKVLHCLVITNWISSDRRVEIQLAHNAVTGQDDKSILENLYSNLDLDGKLYSGLIDQDFGKLDDPKASGISVGSPEYMEFNLSFLPDDAVRFTELMAKITKRAEKNTQYVGSMEQFHKLFDAVVDIKTHQNVQSMALAFLTMAEIVADKLPEVEKAWRRAKQGSVDVD